MGDYYGNGGAGAGQQQQSPSLSFPGNNNSNSNNSAANSNRGLDTGKIFVGGLSWQTTEESLRWHFEQYGAVVSTEIMRDRHTGDPRGFGFVVFSDPATVELVMQEPNHEVNHKIIDVKRAQARGMAPPSIHNSASPNNNNNQAASPTNNNSQHNAFHNSNNASAGSQSLTNHASEELTPEQAQTKVFVGGIPPHIDRDALREIFSEFGPVTDAVVMIDQQTQRSRCFGFVTFDAGSDGAIKSVEAQPLQIAGRRVEVKLATPRAEGGNRRPIVAAAASAGPRTMGLRAGQVSATSTGEFAGLAVAYGRNGWKAGYGSKAFGKAGWNVQGWDEGGKAFEKSGFSFAMLDHHPQRNPKQEPLDEHEPASKRSRH